MISPKPRQTPLDGDDRDPEMATVRPKSPRTVGAKNDKEESIWDKLGTLGRKKRIKEGKNHKSDLLFRVKK